MKPERQTEQPCNARPQLPDDQLFFSPKELASLLEMSVSWVYDQLSMGAIRSGRIGERGAIRIHRSEVERLLDEFYPD